MLNVKDEFWFACYFSHIEGLMYTKLSSDRRMVVELYIKNSGYTNNASKPQEETRCDAVAALG